MGEKKGELIGIFPVWITYQKKRIQLNAVKCKGKKRKKQIYRNNK